MKAFRTLLKIAERDLETLRRALGDQMLKEANVVQRIHGHEQTIRNEQLLAQRDYESARAYGGYAAAALQIRKALDAERTLAETRLAAIDALLNYHSAQAQLERLT